MALHTSKGSTIPAVLTHDFFGRDVLDAFGSMDSATLDERDAFLLGNQGPDPLFFLAISPSLRPFAKLGSRMHKEQTTKLIETLHHALEILPENEQAVGRAYAQGFLGHYVLDSHAHPLIYWTEYSLCDAGIEGLSRQNKRAVHAEIERELDELVLTKKRKQTVREYPAIANTLEASPEVLATIQKLYSYLALVVYGQQIPADLFASAVECYRIALGAFHSPRGIKRALIKYGETGVRNILVRNKIQVQSYSFFAAMAHKAQLVEESWFENRQHQNWENPFTGEVRNASFWDLYEEALENMAHAIELFENNYFTIEDAREITHDINFSGEPTVATLTVEE